ncbi:MAG: hypothetical protein AAF630_09870 [Cyanobacteria bacterium P01_C01_bin.38]
MSPASNQLSIINDQLVSYQLSMINYQLPKKSVVRARCSLVKVASEQDARTTYNFIIDTLPSGRWEILPSLDSIA